jgi:hypothetical protein
MYEDENGKPTGHGSVIITRLEEAQRAYRTSFPLFAGGPSPPIIANVSTPGALSRKGWDGHRIAVVLAKRVNGGALDNMEGPTESPELTSSIPSSAPYPNTFRQVSEVSPPISPR